MDFDPDFFARNHYYADIASVPEVEADIANGYLAVTARELAEPLFEMALFRVDDGSTLLVTSALQRDPVCSRYEGFVLRYEAGVWQQADALPDIEARWFYGDAIWPEVLPPQRIRLYPPRRGTTLKIEPNPACDEETLTERDWNGPSVQLRWSSQNTRFMRMR